MVNNKGYTIQQIADIADVPKITMYKFISNGPYTGKIGPRNARIYSETVKNRIILDFLSNRPFTEQKLSETVDDSTENNYLSDYISSLESQINHLKESLNDKNTELSNYQTNLEISQKLLDQSQQLQLDLQHQLAENEQNKSQLLIENKELHDELTQTQNKGFWKRLFNI